MLILLVFMLLNSVPFPIPDSIYSPLYKFRPRPEDLRYVPEEGLDRFALGLFYPFRMEFDFRELQVSREKHLFHGVSTWRSALTYEGPVSLGLEEKEVGRFITLKDSILFYFEGGGGFISGELKNSVDYIHGKREILHGGDVQIGYRTGNTVLFVETNPIFYNAFGGGFLWENGFFLIKLREDFYPALKFYYLYRGFSLKILRDRKIFLGDIEKFDYFLADSLPLRIRSKKKVEGITLGYKGFYLQFTRNIFDEIYRPDPISLYLSKFRDTKENRLDVGLRSERVFLNYTRVFSDINIFQEKGYLGYKVAFKNFEFSYYLHYLFHGKSALWSDVSLGLKLKAKLECFLRVNNIFNSRDEIFPGLMIKRRYFEIGIRKRERI
ncbi:MAG TPA: hypothetical protein ENH14_01145 [candidate division WOR-3 bacterium]|uniref:Uncharacterized protein n=1 Tax=candidate division WOR-3 bacterium TaxID=2052148 RepID=A0A7V0LTP1_UNCW3|nr:hypothetical protein [candidate division WOR-3 bacterium]